MVDSPAASSPANEQTSVESQTGNGTGQDFNIDDLFAGLALGSEADLDKSEAEASQAAGTEAPQVDQSTTGAPTTPAKTDAQAPAKAESTAPADADWDPSLPFHTHPRWKDKIASERRALEEAAAARAENEAYRKALGGRTPEEVSPLARLQAMLQSSDPDVADEAYRELAAIQERLAPLARSAKPKLPADLAEKVEAGLISEEIAEEFVRTRSQLEAQQRYAQQERVNQATAQQRVFAESIRSSVAAERETWKAEPDYDAKLPVVQSELQRLIGVFGAPQNPQAAVLLAKMAKASVDALPEFVRPAQTTAARKTPVSPITDGGTASRHTTPPVADENDPFRGLPLRSI